MKVWVEPIVMGGKFVRFGAAAGTRTHCAALAADPDQASELAVPLSRISIQEISPMGNGIANVILRVPEETEIFLAS